MSDLIAGQIRQLSPTLWRLIAPNAGLMTGPGTNTYFFGDSDGIAVIDPGPAIAEHCEQILELCPGPIKAILVTHTHRDHSPAATLLQDSCGVPLVGVAPPATPENDGSFSPDISPADGDEIESIALSLRAIETPGHASNHLCYWNESAGVLFTGDHLMNGSTVVIAPPDGNMGQYLESLRRLQQFNLKTIAPGHGGLIDKPQALIDWTIKHRLEREQKVIAALQAHAPVRLGRLIAHVYGDVDERLHPIAKYSLWAHLLKLAEEGVASEVDENWILN